MNFGDLLILGELASLCGVSFLLQIIASKVYSHSEVTTWQMSGGGGNVCGTILKIFDKLGYMEYRLMQIAGLSKDNLCVTVQTVKDAVCAGHSVEQILEMIDGRKIT